MILIDDAGSGSLIGGTVIGAMRKETQEYYYNIIPLKYYSPELFDKKEYLNKASTITIDLLHKLSLEKDEDIRVCRGYMFDELRVWLNDNNYKYKSVSVEDPLQIKIENTFEEYTVGLGFPKRFISYTKYPFHFHRILRWVYADYENRVKLCKTGWKSWQKHGDQPLSISYANINKSKYTCLKCDEKIEDNSNVKVMKFISNRPQKLYLHTNC